ncbi:cytochrome c3 family protein [Anaeromyxobacter terrae]|uniref:cytochrome c3 family protein n=1 Tax=Anaeromyxobacter terrae TaxID=2925406 RepID=UPI001F56DD77|nr:cytochrome c3 family protein [Anaeromyxobacter sp. SG22]
MPRGQLIIALAALLSVGAATALDAPADAERIAMLGAGSRLVPELAERALPPAPQQIALQTRSYGTVTVDHPAHLARRAHCVSCHGEGPIQKIEFTPRLAHERCRGCHKEQQAGPLTCRGCHVLPAPAEKPLLAQNVAETPPLQIARAGAAPADATTPSSAATASSLAATRGGAVDSGRPGPPRASATSLTTVAAGESVPSSPAGVPLRRVLEVGFAGGTGLGPAVRLLSRQEHMVLSHSFDRVGGSRARSLGLLGVGKGFPVHDGVEVVALGLGGFDIVESPTATLLPAAGARIGVIWSVRQRFVETIDVSITGVADLTRSHALGQEVGGGTVFATIAAGIPLQ